ncbi:MAG TPA: hypothetical protein RMH99_00875 [Sandaracinaceae bacterium LLY-WYZ-13_1]|nr:hypothetical protein [Sandaracinaceae bacterium LLY-WYZ-13_1]
MPADDGAAALLVLGGPLARWRAPGAWVAEPAGQVDARRLPVPESRLRFVVPGGFVLLGTAQAASFRSNVDGRPERADLWSAAADAAAVVQVAGRPRLIAAADGVTQAWDVSDLGDVRPVAAGLALPGDVVALRRARSGGRDDHLVTLEDGLVRVWAADSSVFSPADAAVVPGRARALREADFDGDGRDELVVATSAGLTLLSLEPDGRIRSLDPVPDTLDAGAPHVAAAAPGAPRTLAWSTPTDVRAVTVGPDLEARAPRSWLRRSGVTSLATGDFDADGDVDLVFTDPLGVHVVEGSR